MKSEEIPSEFVNIAKHINEQWLTGDNVQVEIYWSQGDIVNDMWMLRLIDILTSEIIAEFIPFEFANGSMIRLLVSTYRKGIARGTVEGMQSAAESMVSRIVQTAFSGRKNVSINHIDPLFQQLLKGTSIRDLTVLSAKSSVENLPVNAIPIGNHSYVESRQVVEINSLEDLPSEEMPGVIYQVDRFRRYAWDSHQGIYRRIVWVVSRNNRYITPEFSN